ncbi:MAG TPA: serine/threonine-protein kinase [Acidimicrobiia bacterium]|nr:serine/threonine-protein kinase [Acidimicrobiia bacterium]
MIATHTILQSRYRIDDLIDRGGMADVYRGRDVRLERDVAVKVLREVEHERRFATEAQTLARLQHPNLVRLLDAGTDNGDAFLVLELLGGATVRQLLDGGALPSDRVARIGGETTAALDYIHRQGIVHRDVKPSNLMFDDYGSIRLADFGIARLLGGTRITGTHQAIGTMAYIAPEQLEGGEVGPPTDVYSLGLVLIECLTGRRAFDGPPAEAAAARLSRDPDIPAGLPGGWPGMLGAMTARDPHARPSAAAVRDHLAGRAADPASGLATAPVAAAAVASTDPGGTATMPATAMRTEVRPAPLAPARRRRRLPWAMGLLVAAVLAGAAVAGLAAYNAGSEGGSPPATTAPAPVTTLAPPTTLPPPTAPPAPPDNRGKGDGGGAQKQLKKWLDEMRKQLEKAQRGD